jgi:hypothetical protein
VVYVLATRHHIRPVARAGTLRLYSREALGEVREELNLIESRRNQNPLAEKVFFASQLQQSKEVRHE